jgi:hypothetical protein
MRGTLVLGVLCACSGSDHTTNVKPTLRFADRSDTEIARLISAAGGTDMSAAQVEIEQFSPPRTDPCPALSVAGNTATLTGGCTTTDGMTLAGIATVQNPLGWDGTTYVYNHPTVYTLEQYAITQASTVMTFDGYVNYDLVNSVEECDLTTTELGLTVRSDLYYKCDAGRSCSLEGSGLELDGAGGALVSGGISVSNNVETASYTLRGVDTLSVKITQGCISWSIAGTDRQQVCP